MKSLVQLNLNQIVISEPILDEVINIAGRLWGEGKKNEPAVLDYLYFVLGLSESTDIADKNYSFVTAPSFFVAYDSSENEREIGIYALKLWEEMTNYAINFKEVLRDEQTAELINKIKTGSDLLKKDTPEIIIKLLKSEDIRAVEIGINALWVMGSIIEGNSPIQFVKTLNQTDKSFLKETLKPNLSSNYKTKIDLIEKLYESHMANLEVEKYFKHKKTTVFLFSRDTLKNLISVAASTKEIQDHISKARKGGLERECGLLNLDMCERMSLRPDAMKIMQSLANRRPDLPNAFLSKMLVITSHRNDQNLSSFLLENFSTNPTVFDDPEILKSSLKFTNKDLIKAFVDKGALRFKEEDLTIKLLNFIKENNLIIEKSEFDYLTESWVKKNNSVIALRFLKMGGEVPLKLDPDESLDSISDSLIVLYLQPEIKNGIKSSRKFSKISHLAIKDFIKNTNTTPTSETKEQLKALEESLRLALIKAYDLDLKKVSQDFLGSERQNSDDFARQIISSENFAGVRDFIAEKITAILVPNSLTCMGSRLEVEISEENKEALIANFSRRENIQGVIASRATPSSITQTISSNQIEAEELQRV